jgi:hypothetical protein
MVIDFLNLNRRRVRATLMDVGNRCAIDQKAEQFRATVVAARIHFPFTPVDQRKIEIGNHHAFSGAQRLTNQFPLRRDNRCKAATGDCRELGRAVRRLL